MRSEKEIRKKDFDDFIMFDEGNDGEMYPMLNEYGLRQWLLEGEPRYSVKEMEKIMDAWVTYHDERIPVKDFLGRIKQQPEKVKEILESD